MPRHRPPYPVVKGLNGQPTVIDNVKTLASVEPIIRNGAAWYRGIGTDKSPGTAIFFRGGGCGPRRSGGNPHGGHPQKPDLRCLRRHSPKKDFQGRADRRSVRWLSVRGISGHLHRFRLPDPGRGHDGFWRTGGHGPGFLHGGYRQVFSGVHPERILRQMYFFAGWAPIIY